MKTARLSRFNLIFIADTAYSLHQWMILTLLIKWSTPLNIGYFNYALAITAPIVMFCWLNASTILTAERAGLTNFWLFIKTRFSLLSAGVFVLLGVYYFFGEADILLLTLLVYLNKYMESFADLAYGFLQGHTAFKEVAVSKIFRSLLNVSGAALVLFTTHSIHGFVLALIAGNLIMLLAYDLPTIRRVGRGFDNQALDLRYRSGKELFLKAMPLGFVALLIALNANIPRLFVGRTIGTEELGYYASIAYLLVLGSLFIHSLIAVLLPNFSSETGERQSLPELRKLTRSMLLMTNIVGILLIVGAIFFGKWGLTIFYNASFVQYHLIFVLMMVASLFFYNSTVIQALLTGFQQFRIQTISIFGSVVVNLIACSFLIPLYGLYGATIAYTLCAVTQIVLLLPALYRSLYPRDVTLVVEQSS
ncbi:MULTISPECIES: oligosaccharide flippase family protein [Exiguobacterium]|uniref:Oligosaccharide flippase family protein n=1 Tax=Exiguobacterium acetylicum TaxID=41170 RepID=A0ABX8G9D4_EXIAC|nr:MULTISPECIES: oligosaccharide flippase family protein [Exiguobacterium]QWB29687.1 oligosaccharide flippase family protein [Exiguobacterium acetylicum]HCD57882.1 polysaccharide biosynthesis protein [Exiguobacterium sp.]